MASSLEHTSPAATPIGVPTAAGSNLALAIRCLRAPQWLHYLPLSWGVLLVLGTAGLLNAAAGTAITAGCLAYAYGITAITDRLGDRSVDKNPLAGREQVPTVVRLAVAGSAAGALALAGWLGTTSLVATLVGLAFGTLYSVGPRFKRVPFLSLTFNGGIFVPLVFVGLGSLGVSATMAGLALLLAVLITQNQLLHEIADADEDRAAGDRTTVGRIGAANARYAARVLGVAGVLALVVIPGFAPLATAGLVGLIAVELAVFRGAAERDAVAVRRRHRYVAFAVGAAVFVALWLGLGGLGAGWLG